VRIYRGGIGDWVAAGLAIERPRAGVDVSIFVTRTPPGRAVELHVHP
jgi:hypothetical protein